MTRTTVKIGFCLAIVAGLLLCLTLGDVKADRDSGSASGSAQRNQLSSPDSESSSKMMIAIEETVRLNAAKQSSLRTEIDQLSDEASILAKQREIERLSLETEKSILSIQAEHARKLGRTDLADRIDEDIRKLEQPVRAERKAPTNRTTRPDDDIR
jgi:hypothetical protein